MKKALLLVAVLALCSACSLATQTKSGSAGDFTGDWRLDMDSLDNAATSSKAIRFNADGTTTQGYLVNDRYEARDHANWTIERDTVVITRNSGGREISRFVFDSPDRFRILKDDGTTKVWAVRLQLAR